MFTKLKFFAASAMLVATFSACSDDSSPNGISNDLNIVNNTDKPGLDKAGFGNSVRRNFG